MRNLIILFLLVLSVEGKAQGYIEYYRESIKAYEAENWPAFLDLTLKADSLRPNHRSFLYNLAVAYTLNGRQEKAIETLSYRSDFYADGEVLTDPEFESLHSYKTWSDLENKILGYNEMKDGSELAFTIKKENFHPEGVAYSEEERRFYFTDIRNGLILSFNEEGREEKLEIDLKEYGFWSAAGILFKDDNLWVSTVAFEQFSGYSQDLKGRSAVLCFNRRAKELVKVYEIDGDHIFGDLAASPDGVLYVTDSNYPMVYRISDQDSTLQAFISSSRWYNLQGLTMSDDSRYLYVSDYITGIHRVEVSNGEMMPLISENQLLRGSDGIYQKAGQLVLLQNGALPVRVLSIPLDKNGLGISEGLTYEVQSTLGLTEPTLGVWVGTDLYYIGNSPWQYYEEGKPHTDKWPEIRVYKISVN